MTSRKKASPAKPRAKRRAKAAGDGLAPAAKVSEVLKPISTGGRPSWMHVPEYHDDMCARAVELGALGYSECEISAELNVPRTTMRSWADQFPCFSSALTRAKELEQSWWEKQARTNLTTPQFNANLWNKSMAARFKAEYGDKVQLSGDPDAPLKHDIVFHIIDPIAAG